MRELEHMRSVAEKAALLEGCVYVLYRQDDVFRFCRDGEYYAGEFVEYVFP